MLRSTHVLPTFAFLLGAFAACSGTSTAPIGADEENAVVPPGGDDGGSTFPGTDGGAIPPGDASDDDAAGGGGDAGPDGGGTSRQCQLLRTQVDRLRPAASACSLDDKDVCGHLIDDVCCPLTVSDPLSEDAQRFSEAVKAFKSARCSAFCPKVLCPEKPSRSCPLLGSIGEKPTCRQ